MLNRALQFAFATVLVTSSARADIPVIDDAVLKEPCEVAKALDQCPACTCALRTQASPVSGLDERSSDIVIGAVIDVSGKLASGVDYAAAHVVLGTSAKLQHVGRLANSQVVGENGFRQYDVTGGQSVMQMCPGGCDFEAVGVVHPFEVKVTESTPTILDNGTFEETTREETRLVLCFEAAGGLTCQSLALALEERIERPAMAPGMKHKVLSREGYKRTWKFGKRGDVVFGKASGKLASRLGRGDAHNVSTIDLGADPDARPLDR